MKFIGKNFYFLLCTAVLLFLAVYVSGKAQSPLPNFRVQGPAEAEASDIAIFDAADGNYYVFLPSYADMAQVTVSLSGRNRIALADVPLHDGMDCSRFKPEVPYPFSINGQKVATLWFYQSQNLPTMYIDTVTGSMEKIHADKDREEYASVTLYTADGICTYADDQSTLKGRGNATWEYDKRPYSLKLSAEGDLLDMGAAADWVLLANATDETNLSNKLMLDLASRTKSEWAPESRWVDVYLNGQYNGLYLLTEKVEVHKNRLNIPTDSDSFLCKIELNERWDTLRNPLRSASGRAVEVCYPKILNAAELDTAQQLVNQLENTILSGAELSGAENIDLDSWVRRYLIDEISGNIDSDLASSYFYFSDGRAFAGPVWDYDMALGNNRRNQNPCAFIAKNLQKSRIYQSPYYHALYANESFHSRMTELYAAEFRPVLQQLMDTEIDAHAKFIGKAAQLNSLRWRTMYDSLQPQESNTMHTAGALKDYLTRRVAFLDSAWLENTAYCTVQFEPSPGVGYWKISVKQGTCLETTYMDIVSTTWIDSATGEAVDFGQPVMTDMILTKAAAAPGQGVDAAAVPAQSEEAVSGANALSTRDYITLLSIAALLVLLTAFLIADAVLRYTERRPVNGHSGTKVPS